MVLGKLRPLPRLLASSMRTPSIRFTRGISSSFAEGHQSVSAAIAACSWRCCDDSSDINKAAFATRYLMTILRKRTPSFTRSCEKYVDGCLVRDLGDYRSLNCLFLISQEKHRQQHFINLIPSENFTSQAVLDALGSVMQSMAFRFPLLVLRSIHLTQYMQISIPRAIQVLGITGETDTSTRQRDYVRNEHSPHSTLTPKNGVSMFNVRGIHRQ